MIRDIYYVKGWTSKNKKSNLVVELVVAWAFRNDLLLADVTFRDPARPIPQEERRFRLQTHKGLGLLPNLLENTQRKARQYNSRKRHGKKPSKIKSFELRPEFAQRFLKRQHFDKGILDMHTLNRESRPCSKYCCRFVGIRNELIDELRYMRMADVGSARPAPKATNVIANALRRDSSISVRTRCGVASANYWARGKFAPGFTGLQQCARVLPLQKNHALRFWRDAVCSGLRNACVDS